jgi:hypothetical protein
MGKKCGANTKRGGICKQPVIPGKNRCHYHGGRSTGPALGSRNAYRNGQYTMEINLLHKIVRYALNRSKKLVKHITASLSA